MKTSKTCPECAQPNSMQRTTCHSCGGRLPVERETTTAIGMQVAAEKEAERANHVATQWLIEHRIITHDMTQPERAEACREWMRKTTRRNHANVQVRAADAIARNALDKAADVFSTPF